MLDFDEKTARMKIKSLHPGVALETVVENTGFELIISDDIEVTPEPTSTQIELIRQRIDPEGLLLEARVQ